MKEWLYAHNEEVAYSGNRLYVTEGNMLVVYDIATPSAPIKIASIPYAGVSMPGGDVYKSLQCNDKVICASQVGEGIVFVDANTFQAVRLRFDARVNNIALVGNTLYAAFPSLNLIRAIDVSTPLNPQPLFDLSIPSVTDVYASNRVICAVIGHASVQLFSPEGVYKATYANTLSLNDIALSGNLMIVGVHGNFQTVDITDLASPQLLYAYSIPNGSAACVAINEVNHIALAGWHDQYVGVYNISNPALPVEMSRYMYNAIAGGYPRKLVTFGNIGVLAGHYRGTHIIDLFNTSAPLFLIPSYGRAYGCKTLNGVLYGTDDNGLVIVDFNPVSPSRTAFIDYHARSVGQMDMKDGIMYIPMTWDGLLVANVSDIYNPITIVNWNPAQYVHGVLRIDNYLYVVLGTYTTYPSALAVFDASALPALTEIARITLSSVRGSSMAYINNTIYIAGGQLARNLSVIDITNRTAPVQVSEIAINSRNVTAAGNRLYVMVSTDGLHIYDITNPLNPIFLKKWKPSIGFSNFSQPSYYNGKLYVGFNDHLMEIDVSGDNPQLLWEDQRDNGRIITCAFVDPISKKLAIAADGEGFKLLDLESTSTSGTLDITTTPVAGQISVDGTPAGTGHISLLLALGNHSITFGEVAGYTTPPPKNVVVLENQTTFVIGEYAAIAATGTLHIVTQPIAAEIRVNEVLQGTGEVSLSLAPGDYLISFGSMAGYTKPNDITATVVASIEKDVIGTYTKEVPIPEPLNLKAVILGFGVVAIASIINKNRDRNRGR